MTPINWLSDSFIVIDAWQDLGFATNILNRFRGHWIVIFRRHEEGTRWYLLARSEFDAKVRGQSHAVRVEDALRLREHLASEVFVGLAAYQSSRIVKKLTLNSPNRVVLLDADSGSVTAIGSLEGGAGGNAGENLSPKRPRHPPGGKKAARSVVRKLEAKGAAPRLAVAGSDSTVRPRSAGMSLAGLSAKSDTNEHNSPFTLVPVYFGTDRQPRKNSGVVVFGTSRDAEDKVWLGRCHVSVPSIHAMGKLESPKWYRLEFKLDPAKHLMLWDTSVLEPNNFCRDLRAQVKASTDKAAFVFVHGFNVSFEDAVRRTAQMAYDLDFGGAAILFSWPSRGGVSKYFADEATISSSVKHFQEFLGLVIHRSGAERLHVIAHSMGNRALLNALQRLFKNKRKPVIDNVILAAPDEDRQTFTQVVQEIQKFPQRMTLYASSQDRALEASKAVHDAPRAGESGQNLIVLPFLDTVDASAVDTDFLGHSFPMSDRSVLGDIFELLRKGTDPSGRARLRKMAGNPAGPYWAFRR